MAHDERDARLFAQGDNPPPRPHPATTTSYPHPSATPQKVSPMCSVQSVTYVPTRSDLGCAPSYITLPSAFASLRPGVERKHFLLG
jgi:hypothetical protein